MMNYGIPKIKDVWKAVRHIILETFFVTQCVLASTENVGGDVLFVGHASTLDACAQQLIGNEPRSMHDMMQVVRKVSYLGVAMLKEEDTPTSADQVLAGNSKSNNSEPKRKWTLQEPPFPPLTHCSNARFDVKALSNITNSTD